MANNGSIDEVIGSEAGKQVDVLTEKMNGLYVAFKQNITAINLVNDALSKSVSIKDVSENVDKATKSTKKLKDVQTEFVETVYKLDKAVSDTGHALSDQEVAMAKLTATMANGNKAAKLVTDEVKKQSTATKELEGNYKALLAQQKLALAQAREVGVVYGTSSQKFKDAAQSANAYSVQVNSMNKQLGIHNSEVGNYAENIKKGTSGIVTGLNSIWGGVRKLANILPGIGIAGIFELAFVALTPLVEKMDLFTNKAKDMRNVLAAGMATVTEETNNLKRLYDITQDQTIAIDKRKNAVDKLQELYPAYFKNIKDETFLNGGAQKSYDDLRNSIIETAKAKAVEGKIAEITNAGIEKELELTENLRKAKALAFINKGKEDNSIVGFTATGSQADKLRKQAVDMAQSELDTFKMNQEDKLAIYKKYIKDREGLDNEVLTKSEPKAKAEKEINRISELKNQFEEEKLVIDTENENGYTAELEYRNKLLALINEYVNARETALGALSQHEKESQTSFNQSLSRETKANIKAIEKYYADRLKMMNDYDAEVKKNDEINVKEAKTVADKYAQIDDELWAKQFAGNQKQLDDAKEKAQAEKKLAQDKYEFAMALINASFSIANSISDAIHAKELQQIEDKSTALDEAHNKEIKQIEQSGLTSIQQTKAKAKADAQYEAEKKKIDRDRKKALFEEARLNRDLALLEVAIRTAVNITKEFPNPYLMAAAAALGIAEAAAIALKPLPKYAKGRGKGKAEHAIVGEAGQEAIIRENGKVELTPNKATITYLNPNDQVISHHDLIKNASYVHLMKQGNVSTSTNDKFQSAEIVEEIKDLKKVLINKNLSVTTTNYSGFDSYLKANIR